MFDFGGGDAAVDIVSFQRTKEAWALYSGTTSSSPTNAFFTGGSLDFTRSGTTYSRGEVIAGMAVGDKIDLSRIIALRLPDGTYTAGTSYMSAVNASSVVLTRGSYTSATHSFTANTTGDDFLFQAWPDTLGLLLVLQDVGAANYKLTSVSEVLTLTL